MVIPMMGRRRLLKGRVLAWVCMLNVRVKVWALIV